MGKVLIVGSLNMDVSVQTEHLPLIGETVIGKGYMYLPGGKGSNQACAAGKAGGDVAMLGCVGEDKFGHQMTDMLSSNGVDVSGIGYMQDMTTGTAFVMTEKSGANNIIVIPGANSGCTVEYVRKHEALFSQCDCILAQMEIPVDTVEYIAEKSRENGKLFILNPAPCPVNFPKELLKNTDIITPNETELAALSGMDCGCDENIISAAQSLLDAGVRTVIVTLGSRGAVVVENGKSVMIPGREVTAVDTTGAGDCFNGVLAISLVDGMTVEDAVRKANIAASVSVTRPGASPSMPTKEEIEQLLK